MQRFSGNGTSPILSRAAGFFFALGAMWQDQPYPGKRYVSRDSGLISMEKPGADGGI